MLRDPRPVPLHHRAIQAQMIKGFCLSLDELWGSVTVLAIRYLPLVRRKEIA
jgi:hypothetical protein